MLFQFGQYRLDIDVERTREFYNSQYSLPTSRQCTCTGCQNFDKAILLATDKVLNFLTSMGIDPCRPSEAFGATEHRDDDSNECRYNGWYHVVGTLSESPIDESNLPIKETENNSYMPDTDFDFRVWILSNQDIMGWIEPEFPSPFVEIEFNIKLPWVI